jgi:hypothetical protein
VYHGVVVRSRRGFWGYKRKEIYNQVSWTPEPILAELSKYAYSNEHFTIFRDLSDLYPPHLFPRPFEPEPIPEGVQVPDWVEEANAQGAQGLDLPF